MNPFTQRIIEFLSHPELPFGGEEDVLLLADPHALRPRVAALLDDFPKVLGAEDTSDLQTHLDEADWPFIAQEFRARVELASGFFDADAQHGTDAEAG